MFRGGGGGGAAADFSLWKGGGTPNLGLLSPSSSIGVLGGRGGGGGPGVATFDVALGRPGSLGGAAAPAYLPASASGGGALNWKCARGGEGVRSGDLGGEGGFGWFGEPDEVDWFSVRLLLVGGIAGAGPLREDIVLPVTCGVIVSILLDDGADGGKGGGGALPLRAALSDAPSCVPGIGSPLAFLCSM